MDSNEYNIPEHNGYLMIFCVQYFLYETPVGETHDITVNIGTPLIVINVIHQKFV